MRVHCVTILLLLLLFCAAAFGQIEVLYGNGTGFPDNPVYDYGYYGYGYPAGYVYGYPYMPKTYPPPYTYPHAGTATSSTAMVDESDPPFEVVREYPGPAPAAVDKLYLIALQDHRILAAISYWLEGDTLHFVTRDHEQEMLPLAQVDRSFSEQLNRDRHVDCRFDSPLLVYGP